MTATLSSNTSLKPSTAQFVGKANPTDVTDKKATTIAGNLTLQMTLTGAGEPGNNDSIGFTLWNGNQLVFSSRWTGTATAEQMLDRGNGNGNLQIR